ncbi:MAG: amidohydrolase family protein [Candidatus Coatesbacteria bacterium]|nr:amidohydrolase family protein [Candidatus Coatesbacteria bacterium]
MQFALQTCPFNGLFIEEELTITRREGIENFVIQFSNFTPRDLDNVTINRIHLLSEEANLKLFLHIPTIDAEAEVVWDGILDISGILEPEIIILDYHPEIIKIITRKECPFKIALVNTCDANIISPQYMNAITTLSKHCIAGIAFYPATEAMIFSEKEIVSLLKRFLENDFKLMGCFCHDWHPQKQDLRLLPFGDGILPLTELVIFLRQLPFNGPLIFDHWEGRKKSISRLKNLLSAPLDILNYVCSEKGKKKDFYPARIDRSRIYLNQIGIEYVGKNLSVPVTLRSAINTNPCFDWDYIQDDYIIKDGENLNIPEPDIAQNLMFAFHDCKGDWDNNHGKNYYLSLEFLKIPYVVDSHIHALTQDDVYEIEKLCERNGIDLVLVSVLDPENLVLADKIKFIWQILKPEKYSLDKLTEFIENKKVIGISLNPTEQKVPIQAEIWYPLWDYLQKNSIPVQIAMISSEFTNPESISCINEKFPRLNMILTHVGSYEEIPGYNNRILDLTYAYSNVYIDTAEADVNWMRRLLDKYGHRRIVFGSNIPYVNPDDGDRGYRELKIKIQHLDLPLEFLSCISYENTNRLYNLNL